MIDDDELITITEAARRLGRDLGNVSRTLKRWGISSVPGPGRTKLVRWSEVQAGRAAQITAPAGYVRLVDLAAEYGIAYLALKERAQRRKIPRYHLPPNRVTVLIQVDDVPQLLTVRSKRHQVDPQTQTKRCSQCDEIKSFDAFYASKMQLSGSMARCKACHAAMTRINRRQRKDRDPEGERARNRLRQARWQAKQLATSDEDSDHR